MPYIKIWIHFVWATKNREPVLEKESRQQLFGHIKENGKIKNIHVDFVNGHIDHVHALVSLHTEQTIAKVAQMLKGESAYWANRNNLFQKTLVWQDEYFAVSVSESGINKVREYIKHQEEHHRKKSFQEEYDEFMEKYGFEIMKG
ncbi:MAG: IS200/IS605 family transposase [Chitinophagaceae bacterium]|nr:IS200/IS605 family transposase [Chitinophagaceae bacterium]